MIIYYMDYHLTIKSLNYLNPINYNYYYNIIKFIYFIYQKYFIYK